MGTRQYIGARYVPKFFENPNGTCEWYGSSISYEGLVIVTHLGNSFTSKKAVPAGIDITDQRYWVNTGNYNAQIEAYREEVAELEDSFHIDMDSIDKRFNELCITPQMYGAVGDGVNDDTQAIQDMLNENPSYCCFLFPKGTYKVTSPLVIPTLGKHLKFVMNGSTIVCAHNGNGIVFEQTDSEDGFCIFEDLNIVGSNPAFGYMNAKVSTGSGLLLKKAYHNVFKNCYIHGFKYGVRIETGIGNTFIGDTYFRFNEYGVYLCDDATNMNKWIGCSIRQNWVAGVWIDGSDVQHDLPMYNLFDGCLIESNIPYQPSDINTNNGFGVYLKITSSNIFNNCYFENHRRSIFFDQTVLSNRFISDRFANNQGSLIEFAGVNAINNVFEQCWHDSNPSDNSIVVTTEYANLKFNYFNNCYGFVLKNLPTTSNFPHVNGCGQNSSWNGNVRNLGSVGASHQNPVMGETSDTYPYIISNALYCNGFGDIQFTSLSADIEISSIVGMQTGDVIVINNFQTAHSITLVAGSGASPANYLNLKDNANIVLKNNNETVTLYKNYSGQIVELARKVNEGRGIITTSAGSNASSNSTIAYQKDGVVLANIDVTTESDSSSWTDIVIFNLPGKTLEFGPYFTLYDTTNNVAILGQIYSDNGTIKARINPPRAGRVYRGSVTFYVKS